MFYLKLFIRYLYNVLFVIIEIILFLLSQNRSVFYILTNVCLKFSDLLMFLVVNVHETFHKCSLWWKEKGKNVSH